MTDDKNNSIQQNGRLLNANHHWKNMHSSMAFNELLWSRFEARFIKRSNSQSELIKQHPIDSTAGENWLWPEHCTHRYKWNRTDWHLLLLLYGITKTIIWIQVTTLCQMLTHLRSINGENSGGLSSGLTKLFLLLLLLNSIITIIVIIISAINTRCSHSRNDSGQVVHIFSVIKPTAWHASVHGKNWRLQQG